MCVPLLAMTSDSWLNDIEEGLCLCDGIGETGQQGCISFLLYELVLQLRILADDGKKTILRHAPDGIRSLSTPTSCRPLACAGCLLLY